jgi:hypothetical protein
MDNFWSGVAQNLIANWIAYLLSALLAVILAGWGKMIDSWSWPTVIIGGLVVIATVLVIYSHLIGWSGNPMGTPDWNTYTKVPVINKQFRNEVVVLDGNSFSGCTFENVTFEINGTAPFDLVNNKIQGGYLLNSKSQAILGLFHFLKEFRYFNENVQILRRD